jgi:hypothetical protein
MPPEAEVEGGSAPLPCRGCTSDCPDRARCQQRPWRLPREARSPDSVPQGPDAPQSP